MPEYSNYLESRNPLTDEEVEGDEILGCSKDGNARSITSQQIANLGGGTESGITREFNRAFSSELLFDKNEIYYDEHELTGDVEFTVASSGHLSDQSSSVTQIIKTDGTRTISFGPGIVPLGNTLSGSIPDAGTYYVFFHHWQGITIANWAFPSIEVATLTPLAIPANFIASPGAGDPETEVDLSWDDVANELNYEIYRSTTGGAGPWGTAIATPSTTTYTDTERTPGTTYHYRIRAIGDQVAFSNSQYAVAATTTENSGDMSAPTFVFSPADTETDIPMNGVVLITASAPLRDQDGSTEITNANIGDYVSAEDGDTNPIDISSSTIDATKKIFSIKTPSGVLPPLEDVTISIDGVEGSVNGVHAVADDATFTTNDYTLMNGNYLNFGLQLDTYIVGSDKQFTIGGHYQNLLITSEKRSLFQKHLVTSNQVSILAATIGTDIVLTYYNRINALLISSREITWVDALNGFSSGRIDFDYDGAVDTNNGLDRVKLYIGGVEITAGKSLTDVVDNGTLPWPWSIGASTANFYFSGPTTREVKDFRLITGVSTIIDVPIIRTGEDVSGNNIDGSWL